MHLTIGAVPRFHERERLALSLYLILVCMQVVPGIIVIWNYAFSTRLQGLKSSTAADPESGATEGPNRV